MFTRLRRGALQQSESGKRPRKHFRSVAVVIGLLSLVFTLVSPVSPGYAANITDGFQPGNIVSDANFYDGNAMSASEVQSFLNSQVSRCTIGDAGRAAGSKWYNTTISTHCVQNLRMTTKSMASNQFCAAYAGATNETGAQIIAKVGKACGVSQKALLVMLQKEQGVITDSWPTVIQMDWAMGYACPDTAPCDTEYKGFFNQVYKAAWQLKVYKAYPNSYRYKAGQTNTIQWHPEAGCGTSQVYIENSATAGLYIYTPYRPNQAALNAGWGTGDGCSSYGNRNFYNYYKAWFGNTVVSADPRFDSYARQFASTIGAPSMPSTSHSGGWIQQEFEKATLFWSTNTGVIAVKGSIHTYFKSIGGVASTGFPASQETAQGGGGYTQQFERGVIQWKYPNGSFMVAGAIGQYFAANDGPNNFGYPSGPQKSVGSGWVQQEFPKATLYWSEGIGVQVLRGSIRTYFLNIGGSDAVGFPIGSEESLGQGLYSQKFQRGTISWKYPEGKFRPEGQIGNYFESNGGVSKFGYPISTQEALGSGWVKQEFRSLDLYSNNVGDVNPVKGSIRTFYAQSGGISQIGGPLGAERTVGSGVYFQEFSGGAIRWESPKGYLIPGAIGNFIGTQTTDWMGAPTSGQTSLGAGGLEQKFERATVFWSQGTGVQATRGSINRYVQSLGGAAVTGLPLESERYVGDGLYRQSFENGTITWKSPNGTFTPNSVEVATEFEEVYTQAPQLYGSPQARAIQLDSTWTSQEFEQARLYWSKSTGTVVLRGSIRGFYLDEALAGTIGAPIANELHEGGNTYSQKFERGQIIWQYPSGKVVVHQ